MTALSGNAFADPAVAANLNGVYLATPTVIHGLYYDLERVEILKGPQGTLYGRNATAGAINIIPNRPKFTFGGNASVDVGNYDRPERRRGAQRAAVQFGGGSAWRASACIAMAS